MWKNVPKYDYQDKTNVKKIIIIIAAIILLLIGVTAFLQIYFAVETVTVTGMEHYTEEEIKEIVMSGPYGHNSLYLFLKYRNKKVTDIPFIQTMDIDIISASEIKITVYEKSIAGYVEYLGRCMYFDKDGIVVESTRSPVENIPCVAGLDFQYVILHEKLPVADEKIFQLILYITQLMGKYEMLADKIYFNRNDEITLYFGDAKVFLGTDEDIESKMDRLRLILPKLEGQKGTLNMENYSEETNYITFKGESEEKNP